MTITFHQNIHMLSQWEKYQKQSEISITTTKQQDYSMQQEVQPLIILLKNNKNVKVSDQLVVFPWIEIESSAIEKVP